MNGPPPRRPPRIDVAIDAVLTTSDGVACPVVIIDLSATGFRIEARSGEELLVGEKVTIAVPGKDQLTGRIKWTAGRHAGGVFE